MNAQPSPIDIDSVLVQLALQTRENALKKTQIHHQIKGLRSEIAEKRSLIQTLETNIEKLTEEIKLKQNTLSHNTETVQSIKATNRRLHQYEQALKEKADSQASSYKQELEVLEEKYTSCKKTFQSYKEYYCQHPLAQKLLALQVEKEEIEQRIKSFDEEIKIKEKELTCLTADISTASEEITESASQETLKEPEKLLNPQAEEDIASSIDFSSFHIEQTAANTEDVHEEPGFQDTAHCVPAAEESGNEWKEQTWCNRRHTEEDQEALPEEMVVEQPSTPGDTREAEDPDLNDVAMEEEQAPVQENTEAVPTLTRSSQRTSSLCSTAAGHTVPSTPAFSFNFSPSGSPLQETSDTKSPAFPFSLSSDPSPAVFPGFRFDMGSSQEEDTSFGFTGPFFSEKRTTDSKASSCPEFVFNQQEHNEDFHFGFTSKSPQKDNKDDGFLFSFNF